MENASIRLGPRSGAVWSVVFRYLLVTAMLHLIWEFTHMPLYTLWQDGTRSEIIYSGLHCTVGDVMIAAASLGIAIAVVGRRTWPSGPWHHVVFIALVVGVSYTAFSEWYNISIRAAWAYSDAMPVVPLIGMGASPLAQWLVVPTLAFAAAYRWWLAHGASSMPERVASVGGPYNG